MYLRNLGVRSDIAKVYSNLPLTRATHFHEQTIFFRKSYGPPKCSVELRLDVSSALAKKILGTCMGLSNALIKRYMQCRCGKFSLHIDPLASAMALATEICARSPDAVRAGKRLLSRQMHEMVCSIVVHHSSLCSGCSTAERGADRDHEFDWNPQSDGGCNVWHAETTPKIH